MIDKKSLTNEAARICARIENQSQEDPFPYYTYLFF